MSISIVIHGLKEARERLRVSQVDLAKKAGVAPKTVYFAEHGMPVWYSNAEKIKAALNSFRQESSIPIELRFEAKEEVG